MDANNPLSPPAPGTVGAIPYFPGLRPYVPNVTSALLVIYLEMHHPCPQDDPRRTSSLPVEVSTDQLRAALQINRRTLEMCLHAIARVYREEEARWSYARSAREFLQRRYGIKSTHKLYSIVSNGYSLFRAPTFILRRNVPLMRHALQNAGALPVSRVYDPAPTLQAAIDACKPRLADRSHYANPMDAPAWVKDPRGLTDLLLAASQLSGDRRSVRYPRLRRAVEAGLEEPGVLKQRRKIHFQAKNEGVEPELPEEVAERFNTLSE